MDYLDPSYSTNGWSDDEKGAKQRYDVIYARIMSPHAEPHTPA